MVARILQARDRGLTMIFTRTKRAADRVAEDLDFRGFAVAAVHGDLGQGARERALRAFRTGKIDVLVATDVAARGLDVSGVTHVINYDCPEDPDTYTHRIGRTGRAGATGVAVTFVDWEDMPRWVLIDKSMGLNMPQPPETYHTSPALYSDLDIPTDVSGTLPTAGRTRVGLSAEVEEDLGGASRRGRTRDGGGRGPARGGRGGRSRPARRLAGGRPRTPPTGPSVSVAAAGPVMPFLLRTQHLLLRPRQRNRPGHRRRRHGGGRARAQSPSPQRRGTGSPLRRRHRRRVGPGGGLPTPTMTRPLVRVAAAVVAAAATGVRARRPRPRRARPPR